MAAIDADMTGQDGRYAPVEAIRRIAGAIMPSHSDVIARYPRNPVSASVIPPVPPAGAPAGGAYPGPIIARR